MAGIFRKDDNFVDKPNRNSFDLSFQNNLTTKFGVLKPVYCQEVLPGDSMKIRPDFALRFLPMVFPVQTRMRAHLHFFYVRNRTIWKDWMDFIGKTKDGLVSPYLSFNASNRSMLDVSGIADMFGVPVVSNSSIPLSVLVTSRESISYAFDYDTLKSYEGIYPDVDFQRAATDGAGAIGDILRESSSIVSLQLRFLTDKNYNLKEGDDFEVSFSWQGGSTIPQMVISFRVYYADGTYYNCYKYLTNVGSDLTLGLNGGIFDQAVNIVPLAVYLPSASDELEISFELTPSLQSDGISLSELPLSTLNKYFGPTGERISALPFRAYEAIYNSFYRNAENNPYILNGVPEYNKYIPTYEGGADGNYYGYHNRNWEDDFLTTAVQTPQQGNAPLVGLVNNGKVPYTVTFANDDGTVNRVFFNSIGSSVIVANDASDSSGYVGQLEEAMIEAVRFGITINDFRNVNSFQRWLENNVRKGYKYRDQIKGHYGVSVRYDELDMPEFIGGVSRDVSVQQITQTVKNEFGELGEFGGNSYVMGSGETINHYCDEHGFIIGILSVVPMANYSQVIPKFLIKHDALSYYFPEFGKIGMQPIQNKEVTFLESIDQGKKDEIFGYQRAWYDYLARTDEVHGLFRTNLRNFLVGRTFNSLPSLSAQFSTIDNEQLNNIFYVDDDEDKILGQIYFDVTGVRPIPIYGIPSIE